MNDRKLSSLLFGLVIMFFGFFLLSQALGYLNSNFNIGPWWPALLIFGGALSASGENAAISFGMVAAGALLLARNYGLFANNSPLSGFLFILIAIGVIAIVATPKPKKD